MTAARSYWIQITNLTGLVLELDHDGTVIKHGVWSDAPPDVIKNGATAQFGSESDGFMTGTEGQVVYTSSAGDFIIYWGNPYVGADDTSVQTPPGYTYSKEDSEGNNATLKIVFFPTP